MKKSELKKEYANKLLKNGIKPYTVVRHSYTNNRLQNDIGRIESVEKNMCPSLTTRGDTLGVAALTMRERESDTMNLRIRKLTPLEVVKLMGFEKCDYEAMRQVNQSDMQIYHECGDSIVVTCLMALFGQMLFPENELKQRIEDYVEMVKTNGLQ